MQVTSIYANNGQMQQKEALSTDVDAERAFMTALTNASNASVAESSMEESDHSVGNPNISWSPPWLSETSSDSLLLPLDEYLAREKDGRLRQDKPTVRAFMDATGLDAKAAGSILHGVVGAAPDMRDWAAIMMSDDPANAARQATAAQLNSADHVAFVSSVLKDKGYEPLANEKIIAQAGNFAVVDDGVTPSGQPRLTLRIIDGGGFARGVLGWSAPDILAGAEKYGVDLAPLHDLADQLDAKGVRYKPHEFYIGSDRGVDLRALANGGMGTAYDWTSDPLVHLKGEGAAAALRFAQELAARLALTRISAE